MNIATIILAAGGSTRLGQPKQLLRQNGTTLIRSMVDAALSLQAGPVIVVLGANQAQIQAELAHLLIHTPVNTNWREGMASSIQVGLNALSDEPIESFLILLTDQPYVTATLLRQLITTQQQDGRGIVACRYGEAGHLGVPALFDIRYRAEFMSLSGDVGARRLIQRYSSDCAEIPFPLATVDLDTWADVEKWRSTEAGLYSSE